MGKRKIHAPVDRVLRTRVANVVSIRRNQNDRRRYRSNLGWKELVAAVCVYGSTFGCWWVLVDL